MSGRGGAKLDAVGVLAHVVYVLVGGLLVLGFAWAVVPAVEAQNEAACRSMSPIERGQEAPDVSLVDLDGNEVSLSDLRGSFLVLNFWASWCEPCISEWPELDQLAQRLAGRQGVEVVAVSVDEQLDDVRSFLERMSLTQSGVRVLHDPEPRVRLRRFGDSDIQFELLCWCSDPSERGVLVHELGKAVYKAFGREGIDIPYPHMDVRLYESGAGNDGEEVAGG